MKVSGNTTIVDLAFNLCGSLAGIPVIVKQIPTDERIGLDQLPAQGADGTVYYTGASWTPDVAGMELDLTNLPLYSVTGQAKAPYSSNIGVLEEVVQQGGDFVYNNEYLVPWN